MKWMSEGMTRTKRTKVVFMAKDEVFRLARCLERLLKSYDDGHEESKAMQRSSNYEL